MKTSYIKILFYYEIPTLIFCQDEVQNNYFFALLDEESFEYIGKKASIENSLLFLEGNIDLKSIYEDKDLNFYLGKYKKNEFHFDLYQGEFKEDFLPSENLKLINPEIGLCKFLKEQIYAK